MFSRFAHLVCTKCGASYERDSRREPLPGRRLRGLALRSLPRPRARPRRRRADVRARSGAGTSSCRSRTPTTSSRSAKAARRCCARIGSARPRASPTSGSRTKSGTRRAPSRRAASRPPCRRRRSSASRTIALPTAGNAGGAAAAYAAKAGLECHVFMPARHAARLPARVRALRREGHAGGRPDRRLRQDRRGAREGEGLARRLDAEGALPRRGQEDDGLRARRGLRLGAAGRRSSTRPAAARA